MSLAAHQPVILSHNSTTFLNREMDRQTSPKARRGPRLGLFIKRTISEDCTGGSEAERPSKFHCLRKEVRRHQLQPARLGQLDAHRSTRGLVSQEQKHLDDTSGTLPNATPPPSDQERSTERDKQTRSDTSSIHDPNRALNPEQLKEMDGMPFPPTTFANDSPGHSRPLFKCKYKGCRSSISFLTEAALIRHLKNIHISPAAYPCLENHCERVFGRKDHLKQHIRRRHP
ncbi:hypothetical protein BJX68DRAFT_239056 [Aspergillus pseudodeflectus]|uniref:C2H2-type domain-containing protein n=1 Tax=Aspergillus pseudodeflectus TaxID=176178 RepID=A0ABR4K9B9_9EURO